MIPGKIENQIELRQASNDGKRINPKHEARNSKQIQNSKIQNSKQRQFAVGGVFFRFGNLYFGHLNLFRVSDFGFRIYHLYPTIEN